MSRLVMLVAALAALAGCKENLLDDLPDASDLDAADVIPDGNWSCIATPYPATAPDPLLVRGIVAFSSTRYGGVTVEVHDAADDTLLFQDITDTGIGDRLGRYSANVVTGGAAPRIYRKAVGNGGYLDSYTFDGIPVSSAYDLGIFYANESQSQAYYTVAGVARDPAKGIMLLDIFDCGIPPAATARVAGVVVDAPPGATVIYTAADGSVGPADLARTETSASGTVIVLNVTPGLVDLALHAGPITYRSWPVRVYANSWTTGPRHP